MRNIDVACYFQIPIQGSFDLAQRRLNEIVSHRVLAVIREENNPSSAVSADGKRFEMSFPVVASLEMVQVNYAKRDFSCATSRAIVY